MLVYTAQNVSSSVLSLATLTVVQTEKVAATLEQLLFLRRKIRKTIPAALLHHLRLCRRPHTGEWRELIVVLQFGKFGINALPIANHLRLFRRPHTGEWQELISVLQFGKFNFNALYIARTPCMLKLRRKTPGRLL